MNVKSFFAYEHLPEHLQAVSKPFHDIAMELEADLPASAELTLCLRKLWEAKNYAVWCAAMLPVG